MGVGVCSAIGLVQNVAPELICFVKRYARGLGVPNASEYPYYNIRRLKHMIGWYPRPDRGGSGGAHTCARLLEF